MKDWAVHKLQCGGSAGSGLIGAACHGNLTCNREGHNNVEPLDTTLTLVDFQRALKDLTGKANGEDDRSISHVKSTNVNSCMTANIVQDNSVTYGEKSVQEDQSETMIPIIVKAHKTKLHLNMNPNQSPEDMFRDVALKTNVPVDKMKLIHKGKLMTNANLKEAIKPKAIFQVLGEAAESEDGLDSRDIDVIMRQVHVDKNTAIRALRVSGGDLVQAILDLTSK